MFINEVKRDKETLKKISEFQSSIENLVRAKEQLWLLVTRGRGASLVSCLLWKYR